MRRAGGVRRSAAAAFLALSLVPDVLLLATGFIPGTTVAGVVGLMVMHPIVAAAAVITGRMIAPPR